jgi:diguanylate cyclase (GGDEF)-like protein
MPRPEWSRLYSIAVIALAIIASVWIVSSHSAAHREQILFFTALVALVSFFSLEREEAWLGFEAGVIFPAIVLLHDPEVALVSSFAGTAIYQMRTLKLRALYESAQLALSYFVVALLYASAVAQEAPPIAKISGYVLLVVGYLAVSTAFAVARRSFDPNIERAVEQVVIVQAQILLVVIPVAAVEVISDLAYGRAGFVVAFLPLLLIAYTMRRELRIRERNEELIRRNRELSILTESATGILLAQSEEDTLRQMVSLLGKLAKLKACAIVTWDWIAGHGTTVYRFGECLPSDQEIRRWAEGAGLAQSAPTHAFVFQNELRRFPLSPLPAIQVMIGIQTADVVYGILIYETEDPVILQTPSLNLLTLLVNQIAVSLQDQVLRSEMAAKTTQLEGNAATMSTILDLSTHLIASVDLEAGLTAVANAIRDALGFEVVIISVYNARSREFVRRAQTGLDNVWEEMRKKPVSWGEIAPFLDPEFRISNSYFVSYTALQQSEGGVFVRSEEASDRPREWHANDMLLVPLMSGDDMIGYLSVRNPRDGRVPDVERVRTLEIFAVQAVMALQSAHHYEEIKRLTFIDGLTPAYNYRYFQETLLKEIHRHQRTGHQLALAMLDIDNFKLINDTFGHPVGDEILKGLVEELMRNARDSDVVARYGGEEFAIILPETPSASAKDAANRLREIIERREFPVPQQRRTLRVTASIGVAIFPTDGQTTADLIARADAALYFAKKSGKNKVAMASELPAESTGFAGA